jgi:hypothetical protein
MTGFSSLIPPSISNNGTGSKFLTPIRDLSRALPLTLFALGLLLRLSGIAFNGMYDLDQMIFQWGCSVREMGLAASFHENYGILSYAMYGIAVAIAEKFPGFWWAPYKLMEISFEIITFFAFCRLLPKERRQLVLYMYWLNAWYGSHTVFALLALLALNAVPKRNYACGVAGILVMAGAMFKPQALFYFAIPLLIYLFFQIERGSSALLSYLAGLSSVVILGSGFLTFYGGEAFGIIKNYFTVVTVMPNLCNEAVNIWRLITKGLQLILSQKGATFQLFLPSSLYTAIHFTINAAVVAFIIAYCLRVLIAQGILFDWEKRRFSLTIRLAGAVILGFSVWLIYYPRMLNYQGPLNFAMISKIGMVIGVLALIGASYMSRTILERKDFLIRHFRGYPASRRVYERTLASGALLVITFSSLVIPQIGTMAHINHTYAAAVLLIPFAAANRKVLVYWTVMIIVNLYSHLAVFHFGRESMLPEKFLRYGPAQPLLWKIKSLLATQHAPDQLLNFQKTINVFLQKYLPQEPILSALAAVHFIIFVFLALEMFNLHKGRFSPLLVSVKGSPR